MAHGIFAIELLRSAEMIIGPQQNVKAIPFLAEEGAEILTEKIKIALASFQDQEVLVITDLKGGTPCNVSFVLMHQRKFTLLVGLNLPLLLEALISKDLDESASLMGDRLVDIGRTSIEKITAY